LKRFIDRMVFVLITGILLVSSACVAEEEDHRPAEGSSLDPELNPYPFDPRMELRTYFRLNLPGGWWANEPEYNLSVFSLLVHIPARWRGNPTSAIRALCPDREHPLWKELSSFEIQAFYDYRRWPGVICRP
jgi:hypothetical protein